MRSGNFGDKLFLIIGLQKILKWMSQQTDDVMSVVTLQLGQCGNQVGTQLFSTIYEDASATSAPLTYRQAALEKFFYQQDSPRSRDLKARAILVDMESKVVQHSLAQSKRGGVWLYDETCVYSKKRGSGNNWADGYLNHAPSSKDAVMDHVRRQVERCSYLDGFLVIMSVAGGTGSGVGAWLTECLHDDYPHCTLLNSVVWPYSSGEVIVQDYNSLLTVAHLQDVSDGIVLLQNQQAHQVCSKLLNLKEVTFGDINKVISHSLASILQPASPYDTPTSSIPTTTHVQEHLAYSRCGLSNMISLLCPHPHYKLLSAKTVPQIPDSSHAYTRYRWAGLLKYLRQMLMTDSPTEEGMDWGVSLPGHERGRGINTSLANLLILRGNELNDVDGKSFLEPRLYSDHTPASRRFSMWSSNCAFNRYEKCCTLVSNNQSCVPALDQVCRKAWNMFSAGAYLHQYSKHGFSQDDFLTSFLAVEQLLKNYNSL